MRQENTEKIRPLTKLMEEQLMEYHERELLATEPTFAYYSKGCKGLLLRGLLQLRQYRKNDKTFYVFRITESGIRYLANK